MKKWYYIQTIARILGAPYTIFHFEHSEGALISLESGEIVSRDIEQAELIVRGREAQTI
jgi:hypothetical protein